MFDVPGYTINAKLAEGACAEIFAGVQHSTGMLVVLKMLHPRHLTNKTEYKRLTDEGALGLRLGHQDNIVQTYEVGKLDGRPFVVLEYVDGRTLREILIERRMLSELEVLQVAKGLARALRFLHNAGVCHKDLKPDNVMVTEKGIVKLLDFGFAENVKSFKFFGRSLEGSPPYMAPELFSRKRATVATDIYALGCTLYEAAAGFQPFGGMSDNEIVAKQTNMKLTPLAVRQSNPRISVVTEKSILTALEKDAAKRYKSADEVLLDLARNPAWQDSGNSWKSLTPATRNA
ncbi:MAG: serine/threonine-protein kinase [Planctomycetota bacterium]|nr:serine/threonine-protein kinase [Planctomycetota bacterium]